MSELNDILPKRLAELFKNEAQKVTALKLNSTQGTISKWLNGSNLPSIDTLFLIAKQYHVSIDWLMGVSEKKSITEYYGQATYGTVVDSLTELIFHGLATIKKSNIGYQIDVDDELLAFLLNKSLTLSRTDNEIYKNWYDTKLYLFSNKTLINAITWRESDLNCEMLDATTESDWLQIYDKAKELDDEYIDMMSDP